MSDISMLLAPTAGPLLEAVPVVSIIFNTIAFGFVTYLLRCYIREWRVENRIRRRVQRARARYAALVRDLSDSADEQRSVFTTSVHTLSNSG